MDYFNPIQGGCKNVPWIRWNRRQPTYSRSLRSHHLNRLDTLNLGQEFSLHSGIDPPGFFSSLLLPKAKKIPSNSSRLVLPMDGMLAGRFSGRFVERMTLDGGWVEWFLFFRKPEEDNTIFKFESFKFKNLTNRFWESCRIYRNISNPPHLHPPQKNRIQQIQQIG